MCEYKKISVIFFYNSAEHLECARSLENLLICEVFGYKAREELSETRTI